jgi:DNA-binding response OmpR family regulator
VLVVEDDPYLLGLIVDVLSIEGYNVVGAKNGAEALKAVRAKQPSLVLLDMQMPILNGWEFVEQVKLIGLDFPIVVMTAAHNASSWATDVGAADFLGKPFDLDELTGKVARYQNYPAN